MTPRQHAVALLQFTRKVSNDILAGITDDKLTYQPSPTDNHVLWVLGHLAATDAWIGGVLGISDVNVPEAVMKAFSGGAKPSATGNPPAAEVRRAFSEARGAVLRWLEAASESALTIDLKEKTGGFANDPIDALLKMSWHEGWHMGQVANVRKALKLPNVLG